MKKRFRIGKLFGIKIAVDPSWILIFILVTWNLSVGVFPNLQPDWGTGLNWIIGTTASLLFFASVLLHEIAHSLVAKARGLPIKRITLFLFGGVSNLEKEPDSPETEFLMAIVGPLASILLGFILLYLGGGGLRSAISTIIESGNFFNQLSPLQTLLLWLGPVNISVGIFNLLPGFPLDGGRLVRSVIWAVSNNLKMSTRVATLMGQALGFLFIFSGISMIFGITITVFGSGIAGGLWIAFIGWFLSSAASQSYRQVVIRDLLSDVSVKKVMRNEISTVSPELKINKFVDDFMIGTDISNFPVMTDGKLIGIIGMSDIKKIPRKKWGRKRVREVMTPYSALDKVDPDEEASYALTKIARNKADQMPVVTDGKLVGMLSKRDVLLWLSLRINKNEASLIERSL